jgi:hypothetical protein
MYNKEGVELDSSNPSNDERKKNDLIRFAINDYINERLGEMNSGREGN